MTVSVLIVDDSPIARKMLRKALPADWDISIQEAGDGVQAIDIYRQGGVELMFLDLTMPNIDGYGVLEVLQAEGLNCIVIVVSADVQPQARERGDVVREPRGALGETHGRDEGVAARRPVEGEILPRLRAGAGGRRAVDDSI
jgi:CheY-like chemotaxis protein